MNCLIVIGNIIIISIPIYLIVMYVKNRQEVKFWKDMGFP